MTPMYLYTGQASSAALILENLAIAMPTYRVLQTDDGPVLGMS